MTFSNAKRAAVFVAAVSVAAYGLAASAAVARPPDRPAPLPEPAWAAAFNKAYRLDAGQYVRRVPRPLPPERAEFYLAHVAKTAGTPREAQSREHFAENGDFYTLLLLQNGTRLTHQRTVSSAYLRLKPDRPAGGNLLSAWDVIGLVTGREEPEVVIDPAAKGDPLFAKGNLTVGGDFVVRENAPLDKLVPQLEAILRDECGLGVRLTLREEEQPVFVVSGTFKLAPPAWRPAGAAEADVYATEAGLNREYEFAKPDRGRERAGAVATRTYSGPPAEFVRFVGKRVKTRMVWDAELPAGPKFQWHDHAVRNPTKDEEAADRDPGAVLKVVAAQTGLAFKKDKRKVAVLYVGVADKK